MLLYFAEGVCVSLPIYYATGKKWKGFLVSFFSGLTEPLGALIGYAVLGSDLSDTVRFAKIIFTFSTMKPLRALPVFLL